ncbi:MAG TPA: hypothetical protein VGA13_13220 [Acidimicrobiales bacterium]|jgi:hypothetical protein
MRRVITGVAVLAAVGLLIIAGTTADTGPKVTSTVAAVERLIPERGALAVRQARVGIDLAPGFTGVLIVNGVEIPEDQLERIEALNEVYFQPREEREIEAFEPGRVCVTAEYWPAIEGRDASRSIQWCFDVA